MGQYTTGNTNIAAHPLPFPTGTLAHTSPHPPQQPPNHLLQMGAHVHFLVNVKCRGFKHPKTPLNSSPMHLYSFPTQQCHLSKLYHFIC